MRLDAEIEEQMIGKTLQFRRKLRRRLGIEGMEDT